MSFIQAQIPLLFNITFCTVKTVLQVSQSIMIQISQGLFAKPTDQSLFLAYELSRRSVLTYTKRPLSEDLVPVQISVELLKLQFRLSKFASSRQSPRLVHQSRLQVGQGAKTCRRDERLCPQQNLRKSNRFINAIKYKTTICNCSVYN